VKIDRNGQAKILTSQEIGLLFTQGARNLRDRTLFAVMLYTACRVNETVTLRTKDIYDRRGRVRPELIVRKAHTKGKLATRTIPIIEDLRGHLVNYKPSRDTGYLFPGKNGRAYLHSDSAGWLLREACERIGLEGVSTHSFRRTALTQMSRAGIPLRTIQEISGHRTLDELYKYLEVTPEEVRGAVSSLSMLTPTAAPAIVKPNFYDVPQPDSSEPTQRRSR
jgi:integrase/recombinase XerD